MRVIHLARKPLSESSVAANVLKHGTGALNIDACRVGSESSDQRGLVRTQRSQTKGQSMNEKTYWQGGITGSTGGRWPGNLIFQHLPGCRCEGTQRVKGSNPIGQQGGVPATNVYGDYNSRSRAYDYNDADGLEAIAAWECEPGCSVAELDEQSGVLRARGNLGSSKGGGGLYGHGLTTNDFGAGDAGGASRFFKQVGGSKP